MSKLYRLSKAGTRLLYKIRHHNGHRIHSPFVFNLINRVIEEKSLYYAYTDISDFLQVFPEITHKENKTDHLAFKLVNYFNPKSILEIGAGNGIRTLYITAPSSEICCMSIESDIKEYKIAEKLYEHWYREIRLLSEIPAQLEFIPDCIFIDLKEYPFNIEHIITYLLSIVKDNTFIFIDGIRTNRKYQMLWRRLIKSEKVFVSLDLFDIGILFFDRKYFKRNYKLSF